MSTGYYVCLNEGVVKLVSVRYVFMEQVTLVGSRRIIVSQGKKGGMWYEEGMEFPGRLENQ